MIELKTPAEPKPVTHIELVAFIVAARPKTDVAVTYRPLAADGSQAAPDVTLRLPTEVAAQWLSQIQKPIESTVAHLIELERQAKEAAAAAPPVVGAPTFEVGLSAARAAVDGTASVTPAAVEAGNAPRE